MSKLKLTLACGDYDFLRPLYDGTVAASGIDLNVLTMPSPERHGRMLRHEEFDVCELSLVGYLVARDQGCNYTAIPVFPHRRFRHSYMVKRTGCGIEKPSDLNGKRVALDTLQNSRRTPSRRLESPKGSGPSSRGPIRTCPKWSGARPAGSSSTTCAIAYGSSSALRATEPRAGSTSTASTPAAPSS